MKKGYLDKDGKFVEVIEEEKKPQTFWDFAQEHPWYAMMIVSTAGSAVSSVLVALIKKGK